MGTEWNWAAIEAIAALAGVVGIVISVIFLVYEVRHNARAIEGATVQSLMSLEREVFALLAENADLFVRGGQDLDALDASERFQFERVTGTHLSLVYSAFIQFERDLIDKEVWDAYVNATKRYAAAPGYRASWAEVANCYPSSFRQAMQDVIVPQPVEAAT